MTLSSLFAAGPSGREPPTMGDDMAEYYGIDRGGHGWKGKSEMKKTKSTLSALTLLAFLFFLNLLLSCLKDTIQGSDPEIIVVPQQRVTRRVSGQLINLLGDGTPVLPGPVLQASTVVGDGDEKKDTTQKKKEDEAGMTLIEDTAVSKGGQRIRRTRSLLGEDDADGVSVETDWEGGGGGPDMDDEDYSNLLEEDAKTPEEDTKTPKEDAKTLEEDTKTPEEDAKSPEEDAKTPEEDTKTPEEDAKTFDEAKKRVDELRAKLWPCCSNTDTSLKTRREKMIPEMNVKLTNLGEDYETSLETPEVFNKIPDYDYTAGGYDAKKIAALYGPTLGPLDYTGVEPEYLGWETVDEGGELGGADTRTEGDEWASLQGKEGDKSEPTEDVGRNVEEEEDNEEGADEAEDDDEENEIEDEDKNDKIKPLKVKPTKQTTPEDPGIAQALQLFAIDPLQPLWELLSVIIDSFGKRVMKKTDIKDLDAEAKHKPLHSNATKHISPQDQNIQQVLQLIPDPLQPLWELLRVVMEGFGRRMAGKGWEESLESLQHPGMGFFYLGKQVANYALPILRETSQKFGFDPAMCKELVVCETSRLAWMWGDEDVTSAFNGVFEWIYGMEEPELRTITKELKNRKKSCRNYIKRCKSEAGERAWLPMIANVLEYFVT